MVHVGQGECWWDSCHGASPRSPVGSEVPVGARHLEATAVAEGTDPPCTPCSLQRQSVKQAGQQEISGW